MALECDIIGPASLPSQGAAHRPSLCRRAAPRRLTVRRDLVVRHSFSAGADDRRLSEAAAAFNKGLQAGKDPDELVAEQLGGLSSEVRDKYREKMKEKLQQRAEELRREREERQAKFTLGKAAYARGQYPVSAQLLERALNDEGPFTQLGGEIQLWLALAYQACGREQDCIDVYLALEKTHPLPVIRKQAADLRYIMEAPKLEVSPDERVQIPVLTDLEAAKKDSRSRPTPRAAGSGNKKITKSWDEEFWDSYRPPRYLANRYVWVASVLVATALAWYSAALKSGTLL